MDNTEDIQRVLVTGSREGRPDEHVLLTDHDPNVKNYTVTCTLRNSSDSPVKFMVGCKNKSEDDTPVYPSAEGLKATTLFSQTVSCMSEFKNMILWIWSDVPSQIIDVLIHPNVLMRRRVTPYSRPVVQNESLSADDEDVEKSTSKKAKGFLRNYYTYQKKIFTKPMPSTLIRRPITQICLMTAASSMMSAIKYCLT